MKRSSSLNDSQSSGAASHETHGLSPACSEMSRDNSHSTARSPAHALSDHIHKFVFRTRSPSPAAAPNEEMAVDSSVASTNKPANHDSNHESSDYFLSDPSHSESELDDTMNSSVVDRQRKLLYQQRRLNQETICGMNVHFGNNSYGSTAVNHQYCEHTGGNNTNNNNWDTSSFGNTSLSSSNVSPMPRRLRIQFDKSHDGEVDNGGTNTSLGFIKEGNMVVGGDLNSGDDSAGGSRLQKQSNPQSSQQQQQHQQQTNKLMEVTKKIKARIPFVRVPSETSDSISSGDFDCSKNTSSEQQQPQFDKVTNTSKIIKGSLTSLSEGEDIWEAAMLLPPSSDGPIIQDEDQADKRTKQLLKEQPLSPTTDQSLSTINTLRGTHIVTEQAGGESSSSVAISSLDSPVTSPVDKSNVETMMGDNRLNETKKQGTASAMKKDNTANVKIPNNSPVHSAKKTKPNKKRLRFSATKPSPHMHRRQRSGDYMAAGIVLKNTQQEVDWIGMRMSGFPTPDDDVTKSNSPNVADTGVYGVESLFHPGVSSVEGESMSSSPSNSQLRQWGGYLPRKSSHLSFSDSSVPTSSPEHQKQLWQVSMSPQQKQQQQQQMWQRQQFSNQQQQPMRYQQWNDYMSSHQQIQHCNSDELHFDTNQQVQQERPRSRSLSGQYHDSISSSRPISSYKQEQYQQQLQPNNQHGLHKSLNSYQQEQHHQPIPHSNSLSSYERVWDGQNTLRFAPNRDNCNFGSNQVSWDPSTQYGSWNGSSIRSNRQTMMMQMSNLTDSAFWGSSLRSFSGSVGSSSDLMYSTRIPERKQQNDDINESDSSGSTASQSSSFDDENSELSKVRANEFQRLKTDHRAASQTEKTVRFDKVMKRVASVLDAPMFHERKKKENAADVTKPFPTFFCPNCKTRQRAFIDITTAARNFESPFGYLAMYFALYLVSILFVFGLEEGWTPLDCVYFAVVTLTTAGLGDFVPSSDAAKLICACFIYFGVATIGLLLGSILAGSLDDASKKDHFEALVRDCPNCLRLEKQRQRNSSVHSNTYFNSNPVGYNQRQTPFGGPSKTDEEGQNVGLDFDASNHEPTVDGANDTTPTRMSHTKHMSLTLDASQAKDFLNSIQHKRQMSADFETINENSPFLDRNAPSYTGEPTQHSFPSKPTDDKSTSTTSSESSSNLAKPMSRLKAVKYIVLTLNRALLNSLLIIFIGSAGFYLIEGMSLVDSFYFTTVLLTTVGYGDIVPVSDAGKVFTTVYVIVAGTILLHNMSLISMIPLELRKHRIEQAVLGQFGSQLTDDELQELSTGRLIQRLKLATNRPDGLNECTREMFSLAMLVRLGRITEDDVKATFAAFRRLDVGNYGTLNSRTVIEGEILRIKSCKNLVETAQQVSPLRQHHRSYSADDSLEMSQASVQYNPYSYVMHRSPNPTFMNPLQRMQSTESIPVYYDSMTRPIDFEGWHR